MEQPVTVNAFIDQNQIVKENKQLKLKIEKQQQKQQQMKLSYDNLKEKYRKLQSKHDGLYEEAIGDLEQMRREMNEMENNFAEERKIYIQKIETLSKTPSTEADVENRHTLSLNGETICVIGGDKNMRYNDIVSKYGGNLVFVACKDFKKIEGSISRSSAVFFLTEKAGHQHYIKASAIAKKLQTPFIHVNSLGASTFETKLKNFILTQIKEPVAHK